MTTQIDSEAFERAFQQALPGFSASMQAKAEEKHASMGMALGSFSELSGSFCSTWPTIEGFINMAVGVFGIFRPAAAAAVKAFLVAFKAQFFPVICPPKV